MAEVAWIASIFSSDAFIFRRVTSRGPYWTALNTETTADNRLETLTGNFIFMEILPRRFPKKTDKKGVVTDQVYENRELEGHHGYFVRR